jgi:hypothetical protein
MPVILPEAAAAGAENVSVPLPAGAAPEDVQHWFDLERKEFDFTDLDKWMHQADQAIRRAKVVLDQFAAPARSTPAQLDPT